MMMGQWNPLFSTTLNLGPIVPITTDGSVVSPVAVAGNSDGFMAVWNDGVTFGDVMTSFSSDLGLTWGTPVLAGTDSSYVISITARGPVFLIAWVNTDTGFSQGIATTAFSTDQGQTWSSPVAVSPTFGTDGGTVNPPVVLAHNSSGYMVAWTAPDMSFNRNIWTSFSADGVTWTTAVQASPDGFEAPYDEVSIAANDSGFLLSWAHMDRGALLTYTSFSSDNGASWSDPTQNVEANQFYSSTFTTIVGTSEGFMAGWIDGTQNVSCDFSTDNGMSWSPKKLISSVLGLSNVGFANTGDGVIATWIDTAMNARAAFSSNHGVSWSDPVEITSDGTVQVAYLNVIGVSSVTPNYMFTWFSSDNNALSRGPSASSSPSEIPNHSSTLFPQTAPNRPGKGLFGK